FKSLFNPISVRGNIGIHGGSIRTGGESLILKSGGSASVILNHKLGLGATGTGFAGSQNITLDGDKYSMYGGYGGFLIEPILFPKQTIHVSLPISFGGGEAAYFKDSLGYREWEHSYSNSFYNDFIFIEPGINIEINVTKFMRFGITGSYLITNTLNTSKLANTELDGLSLSANLKFGWFK
ncbi:MAG: hypothetical protein HKP14_09405, partial [Bacteroidia bacterium]|nr:hypothetical protein [Bacteroidia bacterium]